MSNPSKQDHAFGSSKEQLKLSKAVRYLDDQMDVPDAADQRILKLVIKGPQYEGGEYFGVVTADGDNGEPVVAFHSAETLSGILVGIGNRVRNGTLKWRLDEYRRS